MKGEDSLERIERVLKSLKNVTLGEGKINDIIVPQQSLSQRGTFTTRIHDLSFNTICWIGLLTSHLQTNWC